jgi:hypothetical protein
MKPGVKFFFAALAFPLCAEVAAQEMFKCKDAAGRITYSGEQCSQLGLSSAGEIKGRAVVMPALRIPAAPRPAPSAAVEDAVPSGQSGPGNKDASATPEKRCFAVKTAKGTATRCNDVPE